MKIFGDGELKQSLESFINENNLDQVTLMGWSDKLKDEFIKGDIFCIPSHQEPFGLIIGRPCWQACQWFQQKRMGV